ncbi:hypothetical protein [Trichothermofontia sp.]
MLMEQVKQLLSSLMGAIALTGGLLSCGNLAQLDEPGVVDVTAGEITPISQVLSQTQPDRSGHASPGASLPLPVQLRGQVMEVAPLLQGGAYRLQDRSGSIWVLTTASLPSVGETLRIQGEAHYQPITIAGQDLGEFYIRELDRR